MPDFSLLQSRVAGPVLTPADDGFAEEVSGFNLAFAHTPEVVVGAASEHDVAEAVRFASANGMRVRILATGHGSHALIDSGVLITTRRLDSVIVDPDARLAIIGAGARWAAVVAAAAEHGLAPITGSSTNVGAVGYLLGGGLGPLARSHGFSSDYVRGATLVTADGAITKVDGGDLLWALRGGKGGFGVVTEVTLALVPIAHLYAGALIFAEEHIEAALRAWLDYTLTAPDDVTTSAAVFHFPPVEQVPELFRGKTLLMVRFACPGDAVEGERLAAPLRAAAPAMVDGLHALPLADVALIHNDPSDPGPGWSRGTLLGPLDQDFLSVLLGVVGSGAQTPIMIAELRHLGGATRVDVAGGSAVGGRSGDYTLSLIGAPDPTLFAQILPSASDALLSALTPWVAPETTINFAGDADLPEFTRAWPPATFERLEAIRGEVDPEGTFAYGPPRG